MWGLGVDPLKVIPRHLTPHVQLVVSQTTFRTIVTVTHGPHFRASFYTTANQNCSCMTNMHFLGNTGVEQEAGAVNFNDINGNSKLGLLSLRCS